MPVPRHAVTVPSVQLPVPAECGGVTELRVHGVGGTPPDATLGDLAPEQVSGDAIAGFYRTSDHRAGDEGRAAHPDVNRHVEVYSWGGLTSQSKVRVLWLSLHQWWLAPLGWHGISGYPARQVMLGVLVPVLLVLALVWLASRTWRYEAVRPPYRIEDKPEDQARLVTAAALKDGLADRQFWDGENSVRLITWTHVAVVAGFLAIALGVTVRALSAAGPAHAIAVGWIAIGLGAATVALGAGYVCLDAFEALTDKLRGLVPYLLIPGAVALIAAGIFAWLQPAGPARRAAELPGMASVTGWTALAIAVVVAVALISMLLGLGGTAGTLRGASWVTLMLGFGTLNLVLLGAEIWVAHLVGAVTSNAAEALSSSPGQCRCWRGRRCWPSSRSGWPRRPGGC